MKSIRVRDLVVPFDEYATVHEDENFYAAVLALEEARKRFEKDQYKNRTVLVTGRDGNIVGKLSHLDLIRGLEPEYKKIEELKAASRSGLTPEFIDSILKEHNLWQSPLDDLCRKAAQLRVKEFMQAPTEGEYVEEDAFLDEAVHKLLMGHHQSLLVTRASEIVGILRLSDVFVQISEGTKACQF
jgi:CBS domain-containing protein